MQFPKLTTPPSRVAVSLIASFILVVFYLSLSSPQLAYAAETDPITPKDPGRPHLLEFQEPHGLIERNAWHEDEVRQAYEPDFAGLDRGIIGRAPSEPQNLENNTPGKRSIQGGGDTHYWVFQNQTLWSPQSPVTSGLPSPLDGMDWGTSLNLIEQQNGPGGPRVVFVSISVCDQPSSNSSKQNGAPPQLELYISVSSSNKRPGPDNNGNAVPVDGGFGSLTLNATSDIYFAVLAPASSDFNGDYSYELAVSIDAPYASYVDTEVLNFLDSDTNAALLETHVTTNATTAYNADLYQTWMSITPPFSIFASNPNNSSVLGIHKSLCGLKNHARITGNPADQQAGSVNMSMTARAGGSPKEQFYIQKLNVTTTYYAIPAIDRMSNQSGGSVVGGGGMVWKSTSLRTKSGTYSTVLIILFGHLFALQMATAKLFTTFPFARRSPMLCLRIHLISTIQSSRNITTIRLPAFTLTSVNPFSSFPATQHPPLSIPLLGIVLIAPVLTRIGSAPFLFHAARTFPPH